MKWYLFYEKALSKFSYIYTCHNPYYDILSCSLGMSGFRDFSWLIPLPAGCLYFVCFFMEPWLRARSALKAGTKFLKKPVLKGYLL